MNHRTESPVRHSHDDKSDSPEVLIKNIQKLMDEVEAIVAKSGDKAVDGLGSKFGDLQERLANASDVVRGLYTNARKKVSDGAHRADETIRSHPYESLAVALGVGVLLGALLRRRD